MMSSDSRCQECRFSRTNPKAKPCSECSRAYSNRWEPRSPGSKLVVPLENELQPCGFRRASFLEANR